MIGHVGYHSHKICFLFLFLPFLSKVLLNMEDLKVQEMELFEYKKKIAEVETKLKQQQNLYEAVRAERNNHSKNLLDAQVYTVSNLIQSISLFFIQCILILAIISC